MKKNLLLFLMIVSGTLYAQKEANFWYFGKNAGVDFSSGNPVALNNGKLSTDEGCSSIADKNGNLLFYSDGISVYTKNHELMKYSNGSLANNLQGNPSSTQSGLIVPNPENKNLYYIFTVGTDFVGDGLPTNPGFNYYTIDISKGNGGEIIEGPINLADGKDTYWSEKVTAVQGSNCKEIWILSMVQNTFYAYKVNKNGVNTNAVTSFTTLSLQDKRGYLKVSPDGSKIAVADYNAGETQQGEFVLGQSSLTLLDFNSTTGIISNPTLGLINPQTDGAPYGVEFSQQSTKLYTSTHDGTNNKVFQFDITSQNITNSKKLINQKTGFRGALQLASNGKIYATVPFSYTQGTSTLDVIENPDAPANKVTYTSKALQLSGTSTQGLPPFIQSFFAPVNLIDVATNAVLNNTDQTFCIGETYTIQPERNDPTATYTWLKDGNKVANTKNITIDNTNYGSGLYEVIIESNDECQKTYTGKVQVNFVPKPTITKIPTYVQCDFDSNPIDGFTTFNLSSKITELVDDTSTITIDFYEVSDTSFQNPINKTSYTNTVATNHQIVVKVTNNTTRCYQTEIIDLQVNPSGLTSYSNQYICELDANANETNAKFSQGTDNGFFDFSIKTQQIIANSNGALSKNTHTFQYYRTAEDASLQINEIAPPFNDDLFTNDSNVFIRISNKGTNSCETVGNFKIFIEKLPIPQGDLTPKTLCIDNPRGNPQTKTIVLNASTGNSSDTYKWYLNGQLINGVATATHQATKEGEYRVEAFRKYPNMTKTCMGYNTFYVKESNKALIIKVISQDDQDNPDKNTIQVKVEGIGDYEYALDNTGNYQFTKGDENLNYTFTDIPAGLNKIYIRDRNGCGTVVSSEISIIYFQRHFTPNGDGYADTWNVLGVNNNFYDVVKIQIFNRQGKLLKEITDKFNTGWDGIYNGTPLPSNDYWFNAELIDKNGKTRNKKGHFSLLRK